MSRLLNFLLAIALLIPITLLVLVVCLIVALREKAPPIFKQKRIGHHEKSFNLYKIRTMSTQTTDVTTHLVPVGSVTDTGRLLRRFKIDELPQIINVLNGTMNFIGPRPGLADHAELIKERRKHNVFDVMPGISGYSQIRNIDMSDPAKLAQSDGEYVRRRRLLLDLKIMYKTVVGNGQGDKVRIADSGEGFKVETGDTKSGS